MTDDVTALLPIVERVARDVHFMYGTEEEEAYCLLSLEVVERERDYLILLRDGQIGLIETRLKNVAATEARKDRILKMSESDQYFYDPEYVRLFLPFFFEYDDWTTGPINDDAQSEWRTGEALDTALDVKAAYPRLKRWQYSTIEARHLLCRPSVDGGTDWDGVAELLNLSTGKYARDRYADATRQLTFEMNYARAERASAHEGPGNRKAITNGKAAAMLSRNYD